MVISTTVEVATKEYHTSAAGEGMSGPTWHPIKEVYGLSAIAPLFVTQNWSTTELEKGQAIGVDNEIPHALAQISGTGVAQAGVVPKQGGAAPQGAQPMVAAQPEKLKLMSDVKTKVRQPVEEVINPGATTPVYKPISGDAAEGPSCTAKNSQLFSISSIVKFKDIQSPASEQKVVVIFSLLP